MWKARARPLPDPMSLTVSSAKTSAPDCAGLNQTTITITAMISDTTTIIITIRRIPMRSTLTAPKARAAMQGTKLELRTGPCGHLSAEF